MDGRSRACRPSSTPSGNQAPTFRLALPYDRTQGGAVADLMGGLGVRLFPWQRAVMDDWMAVADGGRYVHRRCVLEVPRQNGKTALVEGRIIAGAAAKGESFLYTAHDYSTVAKLFDRLRHFFGDTANDPEAAYPDLNRMVRSVRKAIGKEAVFLKNGAAIYLSTRTKNAKRGYTVDVVIVDEAQALVDEQSKAIMSTSTAAPLGNPQFVFLGTPPGPEFPNSVFGAMRARARAGEDAGDLAFSEWSVDEVGDVDDRARWRRVNPTMGYLIDEDTLATLRTIFTEDLSFAQECLGYWLPAGRAVERVLPEADWSAARREPPAPEASDVECLAVKFSPDGSAGAVAAAVRQADGSVFAEIPGDWAVFDATEGIPAAASWLAARGRTAAQIVVDGKAHSADMADRLRTARVPGPCIVEPAPGDVAAACSMLAAGIAEGTVAHGGQPGLDAAVALAEKRPIGAAGGFGFRCEGDPAAEAACEALALAAWAARTTKRNPRRKARVG